MNLEAVADEVRAAVDTIAGLRVPPWGVEGSGQLPAAFVGWPTKIEYHGTYGSSQERYPDLEVVVIVGRGNLRAAYKELAGYTRGSGAKSVRQAIESYAYTTCDFVVVKTCEFDGSSVYGSTAVLAAIFTVDINGSGT